MYKLEICDGDDKGIIAVRSPESFADAAKIVIETAREYPKATQWRLLCMGRIHSVWERKRGTRERPNLTSSVVEFCQ